MKVRKKSEQQKPVLVERIQTGVRIEKRILKVLKGVAEYLEISLGDLIEGVVLHAFDGEVPFSEKTRHKIMELKKVYDLDLDHTNSHKLKER